MKRIDLANPILRPKEKEYSEFRYPITDRTFLPEPRRLPKTSFSQVLAARRSRRDFNPLPERHLNALLWHSARALEVNWPAQTTRWQHRPAASAGGRHPNRSLDHRSQQRQRHFVSLPAGTSRTC